MNRTVVDQIGRSVTLPLRPERVISLVPSITELLFDLGLGGRLVGLTKFCVHPDQLRFVTKRVGGTKKVKFDEVAALRPDLIIANKEENDKEQVTALALHYPVWVSDVSNLDEAIEMIASLGLITQTEDAASRLNRSISKAFAQLPALQATNRVVYVIWENPLMVAGKGTFIDTMLNACGFVNAIQEERYPTLATDEIIALNPTHILLSSEPFPFNKKHLTFYRNRFPDSIVECVDGEYFSWYGSRLEKAAPYFNKLLGKL